MSLDHALVTRQATVGGTHKRISGKLNAALELVVNEGLDPIEAARTVNLNVHSMRLALQRRHVLAHLRHLREVLRATASAQNIHHAIKMRAESENAMAKLGAMKFIEGVDDAQQSAAARVQQPGFVIIIGNSDSMGGSMDRVIDATNTPMISTGQGGPPVRDEGGEGVPVVPRTQRPPGG